MVLTLPGTLQTSEQFFKSSAKHTDPEVPPKKNKEFVLSPVGALFKKVIIQSYKSKFKTSICHQFNIVEIES